MLLALGLCAISAVIVCLGFGLFTGSTAMAQDRQGKDVPSKQETLSTGMTTGSSIKNDVSPALRDQPPWPVHAKEIEREANTNPKIPHRHIDGKDPVVQNARVSALALLAPSIPAPIRSFDGIPFPGVGCNCAPPDTVGEVGSTQYVQMVNEGLQVFDKASGSSVLGPVGIQSLWAGFGGVCETNGSGDPVVLYDQLANRWVITQFAGTSVPNTECIAVSTSSDATGTYNRYAFLLGSNFFDYPHLGVWPDGYYMSMNIFNSAGTAYLGPQAFAFDRTKMLAGQPATFVASALGGSNEETYLPADLDGSILPPAGAPATFVFWPGGTSANMYRVFHFHADFVTPANSTFTAFQAVPSAAFTELCPGARACVPQLGGTGANAIDAIGDRLMFRLAYRRFADGHEAVVGNFTVNAGGVGGIRWFELRNVTAGPVSLFQESTYQPDATYRFMGSAAMDGDGNLAVGFTASNATINPQLRYAGRLVSDPINTLAQGEATLFAGTGSQTGTGNRWGDYSGLTIDPVDDKTFWYTNEYYATTGAFNWRTRIGSFKFSTVPTNNIISGGSYIVNAGSNGVMDPGEVVTIAVGLQNAGGPGIPCTTVNLAGQLQSSGGVTSPGPSQNYGMICVGDPVVYRNFTFTVNPALACGATVTASVAVADGPENFGVLTFPFPTGSIATTAGENFDGVTAPALPAGWSTTFSGTGTAATTSTVFPDTAPNDVFLTEATNVGLSEVTSAPIAIASAGTRLNFRNLFNTEPGFDGMVLEISIPTVNGGAFQDIITAGGTFASGGYNATLPTTFGNPLPSRMAWAGLSGGTAAAPTYITSSVNLPATAVGQSVQFKWRLGSDNSVAPGTNPGARIDSLSLSRTVCGGNAPTVLTAVSRKTHGAAGDFNIDLPRMGGVGGAVGIEPRNGPNHTIVVTFANPVTLGNAAVTTGTGSATSSVAGSTVTVNLTGVTDRQRLGISLSNVSDGTNVGTVLIPMGVLNGDVSFNGIVNGSDVGQTKVAASAGTVTSGNFRTDLNVSGGVNASDVGIVKSKSGGTLPP